MNLVKIDYWMARYQKPAGVLLEVLTGKVRDWRLGIGKPHHRHRLSFFAKLTRFRSPHFLKAYLTPESVSEMIVCHDAEHDSKPILRSHVVGKAGEYHSANPLLPNCGGKQQQANPPNAFFGIVAHSLQHTDDFSAAIDQAKDKFVSERFAWRAG